LEDLARAAERISAWAACGGMVHLRLRADGTAAASLAGNERLKPLDLAPSDAAEIGSALADVRDACGVRPWRTGLREGRLELGWFDAAADRQRIAFAVVSKAPDRFQSDLFDPQSIRILREAAMRMGAGEEKLLWMGGGEGMVESSHETLEAALRRDLLGAGLADAGDRIGTLWRGRSFREGKSEARLRRGRGCWGVGAAEPRYAELIGFSMEGAGS